MNNSNNKRLVTRLVALVCFMLAMSFAAVPFYNWFCRVTGFAGQPQVSAVASETILERRIKVRFDASLDAGMSWEFKPVVRQMELKIGETGLAFYEAYNPTNHVIAGSASFNVYPYSAGSYFTKIDCFCFEMQVLQPGERAMMPVTFYVDPEIVDDREAKDLKSITLSYTFYETDLPNDEVSLVQTDQNALN